MTTQTRDPYVAPSANAAVIAAARSQVATARAHARAAQRQATLERDRRREVEQTLDAVVDAIHTTKPVTDGDKPGRATLNRVKKRVDAEMLTSGG